VNVPGPGSKSKDLDLDEGVPAGHSDGASAAAGATGLSGWRNSPCQAYNHTLKSPFARVTHPQSADEYGATRLERAV